MDIQVCEAILKMINYCEKTNWGEALNVWYKRAHELWTPTCTP